MQCYAHTHALQVFSVPLVGVWVAGVTVPQHPLLLAACLRYAYSTALPDRAMQDGRTFLVAVYPPGGRGGITWVGLAWAGMWCAQQTVLK